ncbi:hypothetical protein HQ585_06485 [candidate division KSB1 bacterium]|nr:hypothetical protein [candidate division KSB1 bacterium]
MRLVLKPGQRGTKSEMQAHGAELVCVRYRYDPISKRRLKTAEIIVDEQYWKLECYQGIVHDKKVGLQIHIQETELRQNVKMAGRKWNPIQKVWELPLPTVFELDLEDRIVKRGPL